MAHSLSCIIIHVVFSTKNREKLISVEHQPDLYSYMSQVGRNLKSHVYRVGGTEDHIHIACSLPRTISVAQLLKTMKQSTSIWLKKRSGNLKNFTWQTGYAAFSISKEKLPKLLSYIDRQAEHHKVLTFRDEYRQVLDRNSIEYNPEHLWD